MTVQEALAILKPKTNNEEGLKKAYRDASLEHHPDQGGDEEMQKLINQAHKTLDNLDHWWTPAQARQAVKAVSLTDKLAELYSKLKTLEDIKLEVIGTWFWVSGTTKKYSDLLKNMGLKFSKNKTAWYFHEGSYQKKNGKSFSFNDIRAKFGTQNLETEPALAIT